MLEFTALACLPLQPPTFKSYVTPQLPTSGPKVVAKSIKVSIEIRLLVSYLKAAKQATLDDTVATF